MADDVSIFQKVLPWVASVVFGVGSGVGAAKVTMKNHQTRIAAAEKWIHDEGITKELHCIKCAKASAEATLATERIVNAAVENMSEKILTEMRRLHNQQ